jgi:hypothetical protein
MYGAIATPPILLHWANFYVIAGSAAAALTALQFVVIALFAQMRLGNSSTGIDAFATPTIVYFSTVLLLAAVMCAPWGGLFGVAVVIVLFGAWGTVYAGLVTRRAIRQRDYRLVVEDWLWHIAIPLVAHALLLTGGLLLVAHPIGALFTVAAATLVLLVIGIHNSWDTVTYVVIERLMPRPPGEDPPQSPPPAA